MVRRSGGGCQREIRVIGVGQTLARRESIGRKCMIQLIAMLAVLLALLAVQDWDRADRETKRLSPASVVSLPSAIRADLERRGCTIPQPALATEPMNVIRGQFTRKSA